MAQSLHSNSRSLQSASMFACVDWGAATASMLATEAMALAREGTAWTSSGCLLDLVTRWHFLSVRGAHLMHPHPNAMHCLSKLVLGEACFCTWPSHHVQCLLILKQAALHPKLFSLLCACHLLTWHLRLMRLQHHTESCCRPLHWYGSSLPERKLQMNAPLFTTAGNEQIVIVCRAGPGGHLRPPVALDAHQSGLACMPLLLYQELPPS